MNTFFHSLQSRTSSSVIIFLLFAVLSFQSAQAAAGLLLYTAGGSPYVSAVQYETFSSPSAHLSYVTVKGGKRMQVRSDGIIANIPYPSSGSQVDQVEASGWISQAEMCAGRYPQYATLLQSIGELWKRKLETAKVEQVSAPVTLTGSPAQPKSTGVQAPKSEIAVLRIKSGQIFKKVTITRFDGDNAIINYTEGIGRVPLSDFGDLSGLPSDVKMAIEKVTAAINDAKNKAEAERIAREEKERAAKEAEEQRLAKLKQEQIERSEQSKKTQEVLAHLAVAEQERLANERREQERLAIIDKPAEARSSQKTENDEEFYMQTLKSVAKEKNAYFSKNKSMYELVKLTISSSDNPNDQLTNDMFNSSLKDMKLSLEFENSSAGGELWVHCFTTLLAMSAKGHNRASFEIGRIYDQGAGIKKNPEMAQKWLCIAAAQGSEQAQGRLREYGFTQDSSKSSPATRTSQETENDEDSLIDSQAFTDCVEHYYGSTARGMTADQLNKLPMVLRLAQSGNADAQYVAFIHTTIGIGFKRDPAQGFLWLKKSAAGGNAEAQFTLALFHLAGPNAGVKKDPAAARRWAARAAAQGNKDAQSLVQDLDNKERGENAPRTAQPRMPTDESSASLAQRNKTSVNSGAMSAYRREQLRKLNSPEYRKHHIEEAKIKLRNNPATALMSEKSIENMVDKAIADTNRMAQLMTDEEIQRQGGL